jgi:virginiamycin B lyase
MRRATLLTLILVLFVGVLSAQTPSPALTGKVSSQTDGAMEGVLIGAKKAGSNIATWVVSNAQGEYTFPRDRMDPGKYAIAIRAVGYELPATSVDVTPEAAHLDLQLKKVTSASRLGLQLTNTEWYLSLPGAPEQKEALGGCTTCHTWQRIMFSRSDADEMTQVIQRMGTHTNNSSPMHPWIRPATAPQRPATAAQIAFGKYLALVNLSSSDTFQFPLKTLPRPKGKATQVIYTTWELPRPDASPHDIAFDAQGNVWYSDFNSQYIGKLDPKTGKVVEYTVPLGRQGQLAQGGLQIDLDKQGRVYFGNMSQMQVVRFDPKTEKFETFKPPVPEADWSDGHLTMIDPAFQQVDGKIWVNVAQGTPKIEGAWHVDLSTNKWTHITYPEGSPPARAYDLVADSKNNAYGIHMGIDKVWITDGKTEQTTWYDFPTKGAGCRRGHVDSQDRLWCGVFNADRVAMFDPKTKKITEWKVPTPFTRPYDAQFDDKTYLWSAGMDNDLALRLNVQSGEFTEYLLPHNTNVRHVEVEKSGGLSKFWLNDQHGNLVIRVEPLAP